MPLPFHPVRAILLPALQAASASLKSTSAHLCQGAADTAGDRHDHATNGHVLASERPGRPGARLGLRHGDTGHVTHQAACFPNAPGLVFCDIFANVMARASGNPLAISLALIAFPFAVRPSASVTSPPAVVIRGPSPAPAVGVARARIAGMPYSRST